MLDQLLARSLENLRPLKNSLFRLLILKPPFKGDTETPEHG